MRSDLIPCRTGPAVLLTSQRPTADQLLTLAAPRTEAGTMADGRLETSAAVGSDSRAGFC